MGRCRHLTVALLASAAALAAAGCGQVAARGDAATAAGVRMLAAVNARDGAAACAALAPDTAAELAREEDKPCAAAVLGAELSAPGPVVGVDVYGSWARLTLTNDTLFLAEFPNGWRVVAAGCSPREHRPYDCLLRGE